ncbi:hypothetical protein [Belliella aquatica]|nr:hypothetical protein [Belliella aquatica]MCH7407421.1 hypothetical protein [Belliella aquatica]
MKGLLINIQILSTNTVCEGENLVVKLLSRMVSLQEIQRNIIKSPV